MCGNGLRCVALLAVRRGWVEGPTVIVDTAVGPLPATVHTDGLVRALVGEPDVAGAPIHLGGVEVHPITVGNPHGVVFVEDPDDVEVDVLGPLIENDPHFAGGANVEFVAVSGFGSIRARIWERGVGETLASGTGSTAAAYAAVQYRDVETPCAVHLPGGILTIELEGSKAWMIGPANVVYHGKMEPDQLT